MPLGGVIASIAASTFFGRVKDFLKAIPREVWIALIVVIALVLAVWWHNSHADAQLKLAYEQGVADRDKELDDALALMEEDAKAWKEKYETASNALAVTERALHDQTLRSNAARADALRLRGPGASQACRGSDNPSGLSSRTSSNGTAAQQSDADGSGVLADDRATVPWPWLVARAESCDADRDEVIRWRNWYPAQKKLYDDSRRAIEENSVAQ